MTDKPQMTLPPHCLKCGGQHFGTYGCPLTEEDLERMGIKDWELSDGAKKEIEEIERSIIQ